MEVPSSYHLQVSGKFKRDSHQNLGILVQGEHVEILSRTNSEIQKGQKKEQRVLFRGIANMKTNTPSLSLMCSKDHSFSVK